MRNKPIFGIKLWALSTISGYLLDFEIYSGKRSNNSNGKLSKCPLGTKVVMSMLHELLRTVPEKKLKEYHVCFDNYFTSPDLLIHLKNLGLKATGTVRQNRVYEIKIENNKKKRVAVPVDLDNKSSRGTSFVKHDKNIQTNYISVVDSKVVSILSTAAGKTPEVSVKRWSSVEKEKSNISFPQAFYGYNKSMGGVDLHDQHVSDANIPIRSKKWTWYILLRLIEVAISNATVLSNLCSNNKRPVCDFATEIAEHYIETGKKPFLKKHSLFTLVPQVRRLCTLCDKKIGKYYLDCTKFYCDSCFAKYHDINIHESISVKKKDHCEDCKGRTKKFCADCKLYFCIKCFDGSVHYNLINQTCERQGDSQ